MEQDKSRREGIVCAVVIYGTKFTHCEVYRTFVKDNLDTLDCLFVFDNSPISMHEDVKLTKGEYKYVWNPSNPCLSDNYNQAAKYAHDNGYGWILLLDQDTSFPKNAYHIYANAMVHHPNIGMFVPIHKIAQGKCLSPVNSLRPSCCIVRQGVFSLDDFDVINSGMLVKVDDFIQAGGYKSDVNLDFSDFQFIERYKTVNDKAVALDVVCVQNFSNEETDRNKLLDRFRIYCSNVLNFEFYSNKTRWKIVYLVCKHTVALSLRCKSLRPVFILLGKIINK